MRRIRLPAFIFTFFMIFTMLTTGVKAEEVKNGEVLSEEYLLEYTSTDTIEPVLETLSSVNATEKIYSGLLKLEDEINIEVYNISVNDIGDIFFSIIRDNPKIFYTSGFSYKYSGSTNNVISITPMYSYGKTEIEEKLQEIDLVIDSIISSVIKPDMSEFEKEIAIHDYIVLNTRYDEENYTNNAIPKDSYNVYGVLAKGVGVCQGYAETMKLLLNKVGVDCIVLSAPEINHAWNIVTIDGKDYHVDATWNDPVPNREGYVRYRYLNLSDQKMKESHRWNYDRYPKCTSDDYSFLWDISSPKYIGKTIYYSSDKVNEEYIYKLSLDTLVKEQITEVRAPYFDIAGEWIYFSNYSQGGYLSKVKLDGSGFTLLNNTHSKGIYFKDGYIYYTEVSSGIEKRIKADIKEVEPEKPSFDDTILSRFKRWFESLFIKPKDSWQVRFNIPLDKDAISNKNIYIMDSSGVILDDLDIRLSDERTVLVTPYKDYEPGNYYLLIENFISKTGKVLKEDIKVEFTVE